jgi:hypothetical protein
MGADPGDAAPIRVMRRRSRVMGCRFVGRGTSSRPTGTHPGIEADVAEQRLGTLARLPAHRAVDEQIERDRVARRHPRIRRGIGTQDQAGQRRLVAPGLTDYPDRWRPARSTSPTRPQLPVPRLRPAVRSGPSHSPLGPVPETGWTTSARCSASVTDPERSRPGALSAQRGGGAASARGDDVPGLAGGASRRGLSSRRTSWSGASLNATHTQAPGANRAIHS